MDQVVQLCARRRLLYPTGEIYGSYAGFFDYGPLGVELKRNLERAWWDHFVRQREDVVGMDGAIITSPGVWKASGHVDAFNDPLVTCKKCKNRFRMDHLLEEELGLSVEGLTHEKLAALLVEKKIKCPKCKGDLEEGKAFNLMFQTHVGVVQGEQNLAYLRPETAQLIFADFKLLQQASRKRLPFGIAQIGKAFRNEIAPRNFVFRSREFHQMEIEFFVHPKKMDECDVPDEWLAESVCVLTAELQQKNAQATSRSFSDLWEQKRVKTKWHLYWLACSWRFLKKLGVRPENLRLREHLPAELSHYSSETWDLEYHYPWGWKELMGVANRGDFDLQQHQKGSGKDLSYFDEETKEKLLPHVIEPSWGLERLLLTLLIDAYREKEEKGEVKVTLALPPFLSPVQAAVFPLMKKDGLAEKARALATRLQTEFAAEYDEAGSIGKRYARHDEVGTPYCITVDYDTLKDDTVTLRERDSTAQKRVSASRLPELLRGLLAGSASFNQL